MIGHYPQPSTLNPQRQQRLNKETANDTRLMRRGIAHTAACAGWETDSHRQRWYYPAIDPFTGVSVKRSKAYPDTNQPKYQWHGSGGSGKPSGLNYYAPQGKERLEAAIKTSGGNLIIANGEPAVLVMLAAGYDNVLSWFGENSIPETLESDFAAAGVSRVLLPFDRDAAGIQAACKIRSRLALTSIEFKPLGLPYPIVEKHGTDLNDLWIAVDFERAVFQNTFDNLPTAILPESTAPVIPQGFGFTPGELNLPPAYAAAVTSAVESLAKFRRWKANGWANFRSPFREDKNASAGFNRITWQFKDFGGEQCGGIIFAEKAFGIRIGDYLPKREKKQRRKSKDKHRKNEPSSTADLDTTDTRLAWTPVALASLENAERVTVQWLNQVDLSGADDLLIKSDTGTGKTTAIAALIASGQRVLIVTHRRSLAKTLAKTFDAENYETLKSGDYTKPTRLVICVNSLHKLAASGQLPAYDVIIIDEIAQVLTHLNSRTFKKPNEAQNAYNVLRVLVQRTARFIGMDAYLNPISIDFVKGLRQGRTTRIIENTCTRQKNALTVYAESETMLQTAAGIVQENSGKPIVLFFGSARELRDKERYFVELVGRENVISIYQDTPNPKAQQHFINHINTEISKYKVVLCSPTIGSGVDIQTPVRAVFGFYQHEPLTATDIHQQLNRCRHTPETHVCIRNIPGERETNPQTLFTETWGKAAKTGAYCEIDDSGRFIPTDAQKALLRLLSHVQAADNASKNNLYAHFMTLAVGYSSITYNTSTAPDEVADKLKAIKADIAASDKALVLAAEPVTRQEYDALLDKSEQTAETIAGYERWKIEQAAGVEITPELYDRLHKPDDRAALRLLARVRFADAGEMKALDRAQKPERLNHLQHHYQKWKALNALLVGMFGSIGGITPDKVFMAEEIADLLDRVIGVEDLRLFGKRNRESRPVTVLRFLLKQIGLKLATVGRSQVYSLDADEWMVMDALSITSRHRMELDALQQQKADEKRNADQPDYAKIGRIYIQNLPKIAEPTESDGAANQAQKRTQSVSKVLPEMSAIADKLPAPNETHGSQILPTGNKTPLHLPTKGSGSSINPFSSGFNPAAVEQISAYNRENSKPDNLGVPKSIGGKAALAARLKGVKRCETL